MCLFIFPQSYGRFPSANKRKRIKQINRRRYTQHENELNFSVIESLLLLCCLLLLLMPLFRWARCSALLYERHISLSHSFTQLSHIRFFSPHSLCVVYRYYSLSAFSFPQKFFTFSFSFRVAIVFSLYRRAYTIHRFPKRHRQRAIFKSKNRVLEPLAQTVPHSFVHSRSVRIVRATQFHWHCGVSGLTQLQKLFCMFYYSFIESIHILFFFRFEHRTVIW